MNIKVAIYIRVSTHHQIDKDSLPLQRKDLINYSKFILNTENYEIFEDAGYSGKNTDRPDFQNMMNRIRSGEFTHLLVWKIDRISRNLLDFCDMYEELKRYNCIFVSKNEQFDTSSPMGEAMLKIILVFAELERKLTGERVTAVMLSRAEKGLWNGAPIPLGYKWDKTVKFPVIDENESKSIKIIYDTYQKTKSTAAVKKFLNSEGIKTKKNGTWTTKTISDIIRNPFYKGTYRYNYKESGRGKLKDKKEWILVDNNHAGIISEEQWTTCNEIMDVNAKRNNASFRSNSKTHVFAGLIECGECKNNFYAKQDKPNLDGYIPSIYVCSGRYNHLGCSQKTINDNFVGTFILTYISNMINITGSTPINNIEKLLLKGEVFKDIFGIDSNSLTDLNAALMNNSVNKYNDTINVNLDSKNDFEIDVLKKEKSKFQRALQRLEDLYLFDEDDMPEKDYILKKNKIIDKIDEINSNLNKFNNTVDQEQSTFILKAKSLIVALHLKSNEPIKYKTLVETVGRDTIKDLVNAVLDKIVVKDKKIQSITFKNGLTTNFIYRD